MTPSGRLITKAELDEVFAKPPLREVVFEVRFHPRLRIPAEIWKLQDELVKEYPETSKESALQPNGALLDISVFQNPATGRVIKVSHQNFLIAFTRYACFEDFREEVASKTNAFCSMFEIDSLVRVGLRYVNEIPLPDLRPTSLLRYVRPIVSFDRFSIEQIEQFATEIHAHYREHMVTLRAVLLAGVLKGYVLDIDCHRSDLCPEPECLSLLDAFHDSAQRIFLDHVTEEYKQVMRGKT